LSSPLQLRPTTTRVGRVVYDRPVHHFTDRDLKRIASRLVENYQEPNVVNWVLELLTNITEGLLSDILALVGLQAWAGPVTRWLVDIGNWIIEHVIDIFSSEYRQLMQHYAYLISNYNYEMYVFGEAQVNISYYEAEEQSAYT